MAETSKPSAPRPSGAQRVGRPSIGPKVQVHIPVDLLAAVDQFADTEGVSRSEAIRECILIALDL